MGMAGSESQADVVLDKCKIEVSSPTSQFRAYRMCRSDGYVATMLSTSPTVFDLVGHTLRW